MKNKHMPEHSLSALRHMDMQTESRPKRGAGSSSTVYILTLEKGNTLEEG